MLNEFYNYVANSIINYFQLKQDRILPGERFCLRLDNEEILEGVNGALQKISKDRNIQGQYSYEDVYTTFTVKISTNTEIVIAAKINMEEDFLAKLRNIKRTDKDFPILMLTTQSALDTITSGTADLSANGMPFHSSMLLKQIDDNIETAQLSIFDQAIMRTELEHKTNDRYSDKSSLYEYKELLSFFQKKEGDENDLMIIDSLSIASEEREEIINVIRDGNNTEKIVSDTETIIQMSEQLKQVIGVVNQITAPEEGWVNERLLTIEKIIDTQSVTEQQNPDGLLNKEGGYSACIYFTTAAAVPEKVPGDSIVEKGTDAGGAIEIYNNLADAEARVEYLSGFDGTALYSGSYAIVGTMVIRTSYKLTNEQQIEMTNLITTELTKTN